MPESDHHPSASPCVCFNLRRASRLVSQFYDHYLRRAGLRGTQYAMLAHIDHFSGVSLTDLGELLGLEHSTVTRNVEVLAAKAYVAAEAHPDDARRRQLFLTPAGRAKLDEARPLWVEAQDLIYERLGRKRAEEFIGTLNRLLAVIK